MAEPKSMDLSRLVIEGFPIERVTILLRIGPAMVEADGYHGHLETARVV